MACDHVGYSDTWNAGRTPTTGKRRVNIYLIVYQNWRNRTQQSNRPRSENTVTAGLKATNTSPRQQYVLTPRSVVFNLATFDRQSYNYLLFAYPFLVFYPRIMCQNTRRGDAIIQMYVIGIIIGLKPVLNSVSKT